jgi:hypothetical protein
LVGVQTLLRYRGRAVTPADIPVIRELIAACPGASRRRLSQQLCEAWGRRQANGALRDMVARGLMLALSRAGHIELPEVKMRPRNPLAVRVRPAAMGAVDRTPVLVNLWELGSLAFVRCSARLMSAASTACSRAIITSAIPSRSANS